MTTGAAFMAKPLWTGNISFGLVTIPVQLFSAIEDRNIHFHLVTSDGTCRLREKLVCPQTGKEYDFSQTARGYEIAPDQYVLVDPDEIKALRPESGHEIQIEKFVTLEEVDPIYMNRPYILAPGKSGEKPYSLLREGLKQSGKVAIAYFLMRDRQYLALIRVMGDALLLDTMSYFDEIRSPKDFGLPVKPGKFEKREIDLCLQLINSLSGSFRAEDYKDEFRGKLQKLLEAKARGKKITRSPTHKEETPKVINLVERLKESLKKTGTKARPGAGSGRTTMRNGVRRSKAA